MAPPEATWRDVWKRPEVVLGPLATVLAIVLSAVGLLLTIQSQNDTERNREKQDARLASRQARSAFQLAAVQLVMAQPTCKLSQARAKNLVRLFPQKLADVLAPLTLPSLSKALCKELRISGKGFFVTRGKFSTAVVKG